MTLTRISRDCITSGRVNELRMTISSYSREGFMSGVKKMWTLRNIGRDPVQQGLRAKFAGLAGRRSGNHSIQATKLRLAAELLHTSRCYIPIGVEAWET